MTINSKTTRPELRYFGSFSSAFRRKVHTLIHWGYRDALSKITHNSHEETAITGYISKAINHRLRHIDCPEWCEDFSVKDDPPVETEGREGRARLRPDLIIEGTMRGRPEYIFEAKRLQKKVSGAGEYLGSGGLGCFLTGKYADRYDEAAMLGYVQNDCLGDWQNVLQKKINQKKSLLQLISPPQNIEVISDFPNEWMTGHRREGIGRPISIFHILLDFRSRG